MGLDFLWFYFLIIPNRCGHVEMQISGNAEVRKCGRFGLDWIGLGWIGSDWIGLDWIGLKNWVGLTGIGMQGLDWLELNWIGLNWLLKIL